MTHRCVTAAAPAEMTDRGVATATTAAGMASPPTTAGMTATTAAAVTAAAAMLGKSGRRDGQCRPQQTHCQNEAPTLDAHDCLRNLRRGTAALAAL
jgi:hypothetical protein